MLFRTLQVGSVSTVLFMWLARSAFHRGWHPMLLGMAVLLFVTSEASYRVGRLDALRGNK